jgi:TPR repeat protein
MTPCDTRQSSRRLLVTGALVALAMSLRLAAPVAAGPLEDAKAAYDRGDYATAIRTFRPLAEQGDAGAQFNLGYIYANGQGEPQDYAEAMRWYHKAAEQGRAEAQFNLGGMYALGQGVPQDYAEAHRWFRKAADQGVARAQSNLGLMYAQGQGVPQDYVEALRWLDLAAARYPEGKDRDVAAKNRNLVAAKMTPAQIAEAQKLAREWQPTPAAPR